jgi:hypothetical protein
VFISQIFHCGELSGSRPSDVVVGDYNSSKD